jgi:hypothetical protein
MKMAVQHFKFRILAALMLAMFGHYSFAVSVDDEAVERFQAAGKSRHQQTTSHQAAAAAPAAAAQPAAPAPTGDAGYDMPSDLLNHYGLGEASGYGPAVSTPAPRPPAQPAAPSSNATSSSG